MVDAGTLNKKELTPRAGNVSAQRPTARERTKLQNCERSGDWRGESRAAAATTAILELPW